MGVLPQIADLSQCLFCGIALDDENRTREDVFPKWLQREHGLADQELVLLNGTAITYGQLLVPACQDCNNVHASQLEKRIREDRASHQDMYIWLLKLQLGTMHWETSKPMSRDMRTEKSRLPILPSDAFDIGFLHALFDVLKRPDPQFVPNPLGSVLCFPTEQEEFFYADKLYRHPLADQDADNYSASCIVIHKRCWIALFDDAGQIRNAAVDIDAMTCQVEQGKDPVLFFPELMWLRACMDWTPNTLVIGGDDGPVEGVMFLPTMGRPREFERRAEDLRLFYEACGIASSSSCPDEFR